LLRAPSYTPAVGRLKYTSNFNFSVYRQWAGACFWELSWNVFGRNSFRFVISSASICFFAWDLPKANPDTISWG